MKITLKQFNVGTLSNSSGVFSGDNLQVDWKCFKKVNEGFGTVSGNKNMASNNRHIVQKVDFEDVSNQKNE